MKAPLPFGSRGLSFSASALRLGQLSLLCPVLSALRGVVSSPQRALLPQVITDQVGNDSSSRIRPFETPRDLQH